MGTTYMGPEYFNRLRESLPGAATSPRQSSPHRQLAPSTPRYQEAHVDDLPDAEFVTSEPRVAGKGISQSALTPGYFKSFFHEERVLGRGGKGVVLLVSHKIDGVGLGKFACKRVPVGDDHAWLEKVLLEVQTLQGLNHPNLVSYRHVWLEDCQITNFGPTVPCAFILQQYCNLGDLHNYVLGPSRRTSTVQELKDRLRRRSKGQLDDPVELQQRLPFKTIYSFCKDITAGLHHLHSHNFIHRDIKPSNCLLNADGGRIRVLLSDFGEVQSASSTRKGSGATGTVSYCAPEVLRRQGLSDTFGNFTVKSDVFSLGMIVYFMCFGALPYSQANEINEEEEDIDSLRAEILAWAGLDNEQRRGRSDLPDQLYAFLKRLLAINPDERPTAAEILHDIKDPEDMIRDNLFQHTYLDDGHNPRISAAESPAPSPHSRRYNAHDHLYVTRPTMHAPNKESNLRHNRPVSPTKSDNPTSNAMIRSRRRPESSDSASPHKIHHELAHDEEDEDNIHRRPSSPRLAILPPPNIHNRMPYLLPLIKIAIFLGKYASLTRPCQPMSARQVIAFPLLCLAVMDFFSAARPAGNLLVARGTVLLLVVHILVVWATSRWSLLCDSFD